MTEPQFYLIFIFGTTLLFFLFSVFYKCGYSFGHSRGYEEGYKLAKRDILGFDCDD
jgi:hypothetical protein